MTVIGGIVGALSGVVKALGGGMWKARREVRLHDLRVTARDDDLRVWAAARRRRLAGTLQSWNDKFNIAQPAGSGQRDATLINVKVKAGDDMRERLRKAEAARTKIATGEDAQHWVWRYFSGALPEVRAGDDPIVAELAGLDHATLWPGGATGQAVLIR